MSKKFWILVVIAYLVVFYLILQGADQKNQTIQNMGGEISRLESELMVQQGLASFYETELFNVKQANSSYITAIETLQQSKEVHKAEFVVSAYSPYDDRNGLSSNGNPNSTATGTKPGPGTFAVDPNVIPYGSRIVVIYSNGVIEYGVAEDTGGAIRGNRLDVFRWTYDEAINFGKPSATVLWFREGK